MRQAEVIKGCLKNDRKSQYELYRFCYERYMALCERYQVDKMEAESTLNTAFLKILKNLHKYSPEHSFNAWCRKIIINSNIDAYRKQKKVNELRETVNDFNAERDAGQGSLHYEFNSDELMSMVRSLPGLQNKVFNLFAIDGYSHNEISEILGISAGTSKWYLHEARKKLKKQIDLIRLKKNPAYGK